MSAAVIRRVDETDGAIGDFIHEGFTRYGGQNNVPLRWDEFCFAAEAPDGTVTGVIAGHAYYNEVHIRDLIIDEGCRGTGLGTRLVAAVENAYRGKGYDILTLTTFGFQAPDFYKKLGFTVEFVRTDRDPRLSKYFLKKAL